MTESLWSLICFLAMASALAAGLGYLSGLNQRMRDTHLRWLTQNLDVDEDW